MFIIWPVGIVFWVIPIPYEQIHLPGARSFFVGRGLTLDIGDMDSDVGTEHDASWRGGGLFTV